MRIMKNKIKELFLNNGKNNKYYKGPFLGYVGFFELTDFWENFFDNSEKDTILNQLPDKPLPNESSSLRHLTKGDLFLDNLTGTSKSKLSFISDFTGYFDIFTDLEIIDRILSHVESNFEKNVENSLDFHFMYSHIISRCVRNRIDKDRALEISIPYCLKQINISEYAIEGFKLDNLDFLPSHAGFLGIIQAYKRKKDYSKAKEYAELAIEKKWVNPGENSWGIIIDDLNKKISKQET